MPALALLAMTPLSGCSDVATDSFEVELTTDRQPHVVELWHHPEERSNKRVPLYRLRFPQSYYFYRDNHEGLKQTIVGLLLDRSSLRPLTDVMKQETGIEEPLETWDYQEGDLKELLQSRYRDRQLLVRITGVERGLRLTKPETTAGQKILEEGGFVFINQEVMGERTDALEGFTGYSRGQPLIRTRCAARLDNCTFLIEYRNSRLSYVLPRAQMRQAHDIARQLARLLDQHLILTVAS